MQVYRMRDLIIRRSSALLFPFLSHQTTGHLRPVIFDKQIIRSEMFVHKNFLLGFQDRLIDIAKAAVLPG
jgi:hypothetical protein